MDLLDQLRQDLGAAYRIERELGGGGMSRVFLAEDTTLGRRVVIKVLSPDLAASVNHERFRREIQLAARLQHSNIVPVLSAGESSGLPLYVMPYIEGESLRGRLAREGALPIDDVIGILRDVTEALAYAHQQSVIHRDIKPDNILMGAHHALVTDFGVAKALSASATDSATITSLGSALGTPNYMAPEQAAADPSSDHRADLYALGVVAWEALAGEPLFGQRPAQAMLYAHAIETPTPILKRRPDTPLALAALVMRLLEKTPDRRPQSANEVLGLLRGSHAPVHRRKAPNLAVLVPIAVVVAAIAVKFALPFMKATPAATQAGAPADLRSIAVLPFEMIGGDPRDAYFGDGISEELIDALSKLRELKVAGRTSSFAFRKQVGDARTIGKALGVNAILTGSVQRSSGRIRVRAQLTDANSGFTLWSQTYDNDVTDLFAVQDKISTAIVSALAVQLGSGEATALRSRQTNGGAYEEYLQGVYAYNQRGAGIMRSLGFFRKAIELDSSYAPAYGSLAAAYMTAADWSFMPVAEAVRIARENAKRAIALDSLSTEGHLALGDLACRHEYDFAGALREYQRALALNPNYSTGHYQYAWCLASIGQFTEAISEANRARELDPLNAQIFSAIGKAYYLSRKWDDGLAAYDLAASLPADVASRYYWTSQFYVQRGDTARALAAVRKGVVMSGDSPLYAGGMAVVYAEAGRADSARAILARLERLPNRPTFHIAAIFALLHDDRAALDWLERAYAERSDWLPTMRYDRAFDSVRETPRFKALEKKLVVAAQAARPVSKE